MQSVWADLNTLGTVEWYKAKRVCKWDVIKWYQQKLTVMITPTIIMSLVIRCVCLAACLSSGKDSWRLSFSILTWCHSATRRESKVSGCSKRTLITIHEFPHWHQYGYFSGKISVPIAFSILPAIVASDWWIDISTSLITRLVSVVMFQYIVSVSLSKIWTCDHKGTNQIIIIRPPDIVCRRTYILPVFLSSFFFLFFAA